MTIAAAEDQDSGCHRLPDEGHDHPVAPERHIDFSLGIVDALSPQKRLHNHLRGFNLLAPGHKTTTHVDDPDIRVVVFALHAPNIQPRQG
jgi:hypothetical protein